MSLENEQSVAETITENEQVDAELQHQEIQAGEIPTATPEEVDEDQELIDELNNVPVEMLKKHARKREKRLKSEIRHYEAKIREYEQFVQSALSQQPPAQPTPYYAQPHQEAPIALDTPEGIQQAIEQGVAKALEKKNQAEAERLYAEKLQTQKQQFWQAYNEGRKQYQDIEDVVESHNIPVNERPDEETLNIIQEFMPIDEMHPTTFLYNLSKDKAAIKKLRSLNIREKSQEIWRLSLKYKKAAQPKNISSAPKALGAVSGAPVKAGKSGNDDSYEAMLARYK